MMNRFSLSALVAAGMLVGGLSAGSASAADLGGNCCADLEERIAELEATTARKGNRKVSLTISGWVAEQVMWWDDGVESNVYVGGIGTTLASHFKLTGQATIMPGWYAGYVIHVEAIDSDSLTWNQDSAQGPALYNLLSGSSASYNAQVIQSFWFVKSDHMGKVSVGLQSQASDNTAILVDGSGTLVPANWVAFDVRAFGIRLSDGSFSGIAWGAGTCNVMGGVWGDCNGLTQEAVRYDSPTWVGFSVSASWGADDFWDVAVRYSGEHHGFKVAAAAAYNEVSDEFYNLSGGPANGLLGQGVAGNTPECNDTATCVGIENDRKYFQAGIYLQHMHSGLWVLYNYGKLETEPGPTFGNYAPDVKTHYVKAGLRRRWHPLGHTIFYGEYLKNIDGQAVTIGYDTDLDVWGLGVVQEIDAAAMSMWLAYRHGEFDDSDPGRTLGYEDLDWLRFGALINF